MKTIIKHNYLKSLMRDCSVSPFVGGGRNGQDSRAGLVLNVFDKFI